MNLHQVLLILRARYKTVLIMLFTTLIATLMLSLLLPKEYVATASVVVDFRPVDPIATVVGPYTMATQVEIITSDRVAQKVVKLLKLDEIEEARQSWIDAGGKGKLEDVLRESMQKRVSVRPSPASNIINISVRGRDPAFAAAAANAFVHAYLDTSIELKVEPARQYARWFGEQGKALRGDLEKAQARLNRFQQERGIVARDEQLDTEMAKLRELSSQLTIIEAQTADAKSKHISGADTLPEIAQNSLIVSLKTDISRLEAKLQETAVNLGKNHPQYQRMESETNALKERLRLETRHIATGFLKSRDLNRGREAELRAAIEAQKKRLLKFRSERDELAVLQRDVDAAHSAYDNVTKRFNQTSLESQMTQTNISVLTPAVEPLTPSFPKPLDKMLLMAILAGILIGVGVAYLREMLDQRIRTAQDLAEMLQLPVLGVIENSSRRGRPALAHRGTGLLPR